MANPYEDEQISTGQDLFENSDLAGSTELNDQEAEAQRLQELQEQQMAGLPVPAGLQPFDPTQAGQQEVPQEAQQETEIDQDELRWQELREWRKLPNGPEKEAAKEAWAQKYHGVSYDGYREQRRKNAFIYGGGKGVGGFYGMGGQFQERMSAVGQGVIDTATDFVNLLPGINLPKATKYEDNLSDGVRQISGLVLPMLAIEGAVVKAGTAIHKAGVAPMLLQKIGNNPIFQRVAFKGIGSGTDIGAGVLVDSVAEQNKYNDTLATEWKNNNWIFHQAIPDSWTSDKLSPDQKARANTLEGVRIGFLGGILKGITKIARAGRSIERVSEITSASGKKQKDLEKLLKDPLDDVKYSDNVVEDEVIRSEHQYQRELDKLSEYYESKGPLSELKKPTLGPHDLGEGYDTAIRTKDPDGIIGASVDAARIDANKGTTKGRLGSVQTEASRLSSLEPEAIRSRRLIKSLAEEIKLADKIQAQGPYGKVSWDEIDKAGTRLAEVITDPLMPIGTLKKTLDEFKTVLNGVKSVNMVGYNAVTKALKKYMDDFLDINAQKAKALLITSEAGQVSDIAEGMRLMDGTNAVVRSQEQILDRLELLTVEYGIAKFEWDVKGNVINTFKETPKVGKAKALKQAKALSEGLDNKIADILPNAKNWIDTLRETSKTHPEFLKPLMLAYEFSNGDIHSIHKLNNYVENSLGTFSKFFVDTQPNIPSIVNRTYWSTIFNSILSAVATPRKALLGNFGGMVGQMSHSFYGALREGDLNMLRRGAHQYFGISDTVQVGWKHLSEVYSKASRDPNSISYVIRDDLRLKEVEGLDVLKATAKAHEANGEYGASAMLTLFEEQEALASHPWLRFGANAMSGLDGWTRATNKLAADKGAAFDLLLKKYPDGKWDAKEFQEAWKELYAKNWDENGMITDEAVDYATREIALNLDSPLVQGMNTILRHLPILRSVVMFPRTAMNVLEIFGKYGQFSRVHLGKKFAGDYAKFLGTTGKRRAEDFSIEEIRELLAERNISMDGDYMAKFKGIRNEIRGRVASGSLAVMSAWFMFSQDRIRGNGHWDRSVQKSRFSQGYVKKTYKGLDGKWHSYEWLGPIGDWLALTVDTMDNFESISTTKMEKLGKKLSFILGASVTDRSMLANLEPLGDIFNGNGTAAARWGSNFLNANLPLSGQRNELGKAMFPMLKEYDDDLFSLAGNRNKWIEAVDPAGGNPTMYDWLHGKPVIRGAQGNFVQRYLGQVTGFVSTPDQTPEQQFLLDIEYDKTPSFAVSSFGQEFTATERAELGQLVGQQGIFLHRLKSIMKDADRLEVTIDGKKLKGYINILSHVRNTGRGQDFLKEGKFANIERRIDLALNHAIGIAESQLSNIAEIKQRAIEANLKEAAALRSDVPALLELNNSN